MTINQLFLYGRETISVDSSTVSGTQSEYQIEPIEVNHINQDHKPCISEENEVTDLWECMTGHMYSKLNCTLPWVTEANDKNVHLCSSSNEYDLFYATVMGGMYDHNYEYIEKVAKCIPGCKRVKYSAKLDWNVKYPGLIDEGRLTIYFAKDKFLVKEQFYIYGIQHLIADFGGYLGLLLGYSLLGFYDSMMDFFEYMFKKCKEMYHAKFDNK